MKKPSGISPPIGRRTFMKAAGITAAGYALAVQPISAQTIATPADGLVTADITVSRGGDAIPVYLARPDQEGQFPAVMVVHEIFGQHEHIRDVVRRFAQEGFIAAAPELYFREGGVGNLKSFSEILKVVRSVSDRQVLDDLKALLTHVKGMGQSNGKVGVTGFCWGGRIVWLMAAETRRINAGVAWYGRLSGSNPPLQPQSPLELAEKMKAPVLGLYGGADRGIPLSDVQAMQVALKEKKKPHDFMVYAGAPHAFYADYRASYRKKAARDGWQRCLAWFKHYLA